MEQSMNDTGYKVEIFLSATSLSDLDFFSKSDPLVKVYFGRTNDKWNFIGKTETITNELNPTWNKTFTLNYIFEAKQQIKFQVCDDDGNGDEFIGSTQTTLGALVGAKCQTSLLALTKGDKGAGRLVVKCQKNQQSNQFLTMKWKAVKVMNTDSIFDWWNKSDPYLKFLKLRHDETTVPIAQTQVIVNNLNPSWAPIEISTTKLAVSKEQKFKIECWDRQPQGKAHQFIGQISLSAAQLVNQKQYKLFNPKHNNPGTLVLENFSIQIKPTFLDYIRSGLQLNMIVAIDFTGSNGSPTAPTSLHYLNGNNLNQYQQALRAIGDILLNYDSDKIIPCFGFGAKPNFPGLKQNIANHCFPLSGDYKNVNAASMTQLQLLYTSAISNVEFAGPTYFHPILKQAFKLADYSKTNAPDTYQVFLILTDGEIHDMDQTVQSICSNLSLPISIIIVGVGNDDFTNMRKLDGDDGSLNLNGVKAARDIVQFVPFRQMNMNPTRLASQLLAELPTQVVQYMNLTGRKPGPILNLDFKKMIESVQAKQQGETLDTLIKQTDFINKYVQKDANTIPQALASGANQKINKE